jgi:hypothetical protein
MPLSKRSFKDSWRKRILSYKRRQINPALQDLKWPILGLTWAIAIVLGFVGLQIHSSLSGTEKTVFDHIYNLMQLVVLESGDMQGIIPWQLETARFLLPILAGYTAIQAFVSIFRYQWQLIRIRFFKKHLVVCGLGEKGFRIASEFLVHGYQVIIIEKDNDNFLIEQIRRQGAAVLIGDATDINLLLKARVQFAKYLINVCRDDSINADIAFKACDLVSPFHDRVLTAYIQIFDLDLYNLLSAWSLGAVSEIVSFRLELFNIPARGAGLMLRKYNPFTETVDGNKLTSDNQLAIIGLGKMGMSLAIQIAREWWLTEGPNGNKLKFTFIDREVNNKVELLQLQYPSFNRACEIEALQMETFDPDFERGLFLYNPDSSCRIGTIYICINNDIEAMVSALKLHRKTEGHAVRIIVRINNRAGLASIMNEKYGKQAFKRISFLNLLDETCSYEAILGGTHEILARAIHDRYIKHLQSLEVTASENPSVVEWEVLPEEFKESNRHQASSIEEKLKLIGYTIQPLTNWDQKNKVFTVADIENMATLEHQRWCEERLAQGWKYNSGTKNLKRKTSPYLVSWEQLPEDIKELNRNAVKELPELLTLAGLQICRNKC